MSQDGVLLPNTQATMAKKGQSVKKQGIVILFVSMVKILFCLFASPVYWELHKSKQL
jgi:hypothetical protein